jgi:hypothetical protein
MDANPNLGNPRVLGYSWVLPVCTVALWLMGIEGPEKASREG